MAHRRSYVSKASDIFDYSSGRVVTSRGAFTHVISPDTLQSSTADHPMGSDDGQVFVQQGDLPVHPSPEVEAERAQRAAKNERQWRKWSEDIIPVLLKPYMTLLRETDSLRERNKSFQHQGCAGCAEGRILNVSCIYFDSMFLFPCFTLILIIFW